VSRPFQDDKVCLAAASRDGGHRIVRQTGLFQRQLSIPHAWKWIAQWLAVRWTARGGVTRLFSYQVAGHVLDGRLRIQLRSDEHGPLPVHIVTPQGRLSVPKVHGFLHFAAPRLQGQLARLTADAGV
jgi:hypothetical protein